MESRFKKELFLFKVFFVTYLTAWIVITATIPAFVVSRLFFDVSPQSTDHRVMLHGGNVNHPDLGSLIPSLEYWNKEDVSNSWIRIQRAYGAESQVIFRYVNNGGVLVYVSIMRTDSERKLVHGLTYCYKHQGYLVISKRIVNIETQDGFKLPINLWFVQNPESGEGWMQTFWYISTYRQSTVDKSYFTQVQVHVPTPKTRREAEGIALQFAQLITLTMLGALIANPETR